MTEPSLPEVTDITDIAEPNPAPQGGIRWYAVVLALAQLAMLVIGAWSLWDIAGRWWVGAVAAGAFTVVYLVAWQVWLAPGSGNRLGYRERLTIQLVAGPVVVVIAALANLWMPALVTLSVVVLCDALNSRSRVPQDLSADDTPSINEP